MTETKTPLMTWGSGGALDYCVLARRGNVGLSLKFYGIADGKAYKAPGSYVIAFRLRASDIVDDLKQAEIAFVDLHLSPKDAFPGVDWTKGDGTYASTSYVLMVAANPAEGPLAFADAVEAMDVPARIMEGIKAVATPDTILTEIADLRTYLAGTLGKIVEKAKADAAGSTPPTAIQAKIKEKAGTFQSEGDILAAFAAKIIPPKSPEAPQDGQEEA